MSDFDKDSPPGKETAFPVVIDVGVRAQEGRNKRQMQDAYYVGSGELAVVCDGVGGTKEGGNAAVAAVRVFAEYDIRTSASPDKQKPPREVLTELITAANKRVIEKTPGSATTLVAALISNGEMHVAWCGDSEAYVCHMAMDPQKGPVPVARRITRPHSSSRNGLTNYLGKRDLFIDHATLPVKPGQVFLLCSDGIPKVTNQDQIGQALGNVFTRKYDAQAVAEDLTTGVMRFPTSDDSTAIVLSLS